MRSIFAAATLVLSAAPALAQTPPESMEVCAARISPLGGIGRAGVVRFTGAISGESVCATFANVAIDSFTARVGESPTNDALVTAALTGGGSVTLPLPGAELNDAGPYVVAPGGGFPTPADTARARRVVLAYAGQRVLVIATSPVQLVDLTRILRDHPDLFEADAVERAIVIASGPAAAISLRAVDGTVGAPTVSTARILSLIKRG